MHELCYVTGFTRTLVGGEYIVNLSVPAEFIPEVHGFFEELRQKDMFSSLEILDFDWLRNAPMKSEYYDFDTGRWDFDWKEGEDDYKAATYVPSKPDKFDYVDLQIIKEMQIDANKSLKEIADKLQINYKKLAWHHTTHVLARQLISGFTVNWMGTRYDYTLDKALHRKHRYFAVDVIARGVNEIELMTLRHGMNRLPFLWGEAGSQNYFAEMALPVDNVVEGLQYFGHVTQSVLDKLSIYPINQSEALRYTISHMLYSPTARKWTFNGEELSTRFDQLMLQIKAGAS